MFKFLKFVVWTVCAVALGVFLSRHEVDGRTPVEHAERAWKRTSLQDVLDEAKDTLDEKARAKQKTHGNYSEDERRAVDQIIAQGKSK